MRHGDASGWSSMSTIAEIRANLDLAPAGSALDQACRSLGSPTGTQPCDRRRQHLWWRAATDADSGPARMTQSSGSSACRAAPRAAVGVLEPGAPPRRGRNPTAVRFSPASGPQRVLPGPGPTTPCAGPPPRSPLWWTNRPLGPRRARQRGGDSRAGARRRGHRWRRDRLAAKTESTTTWPRRSARRPQATRAGIRPWQPVPDTGVTSDTVMARRALRHIFEGGNRW